MTPIARMAWTCIDCPDPKALAEFYSGILDWPVVDASDEWVSLRASDGQMLCFQAVAEYRPPTWPGQEHPQQEHIDLWVDDLDAGEQAVLALGAVKHEVQPGQDFRVFLDPAGHPFCLCQASTH
ncbi:MAG: VOC family protein [Actinomycetales bacterium]|nr:VOC family protein [Actinomycetales bacterium]